MKLFLLACVLCGTAVSQVRGTVIVFELTNRGFFIAADSRATYQEGAADDNHCKIAALNENAVFAVSGAASYPGGTNDPVAAWDAIHEAKDAAFLMGWRNFPTDVQAVASSIADAWAKNLQSHWDSIKIFHPEIVKQAETRGKGILTNGLFAVGRGGNISLTIRSITSKDGMITATIVPIQSFCALDIPCASGELDVFSEFTGMTSERAKAEAKNFIASPNLLKVADIALLKVIRLVDLTIAYDQTGKVGGPIDSLTLSPEGRIIWFHRKEDCPEDHR